MEEETLKIKKEIIQSENDPINSSSTNCEKDVNSDSVTLTVIDPEFESIQEKSDSSQKIKKSRISYSHTQKVEIINHWLQAKVHFLYHGPL